MMLARNKDRMGSSPLPTHTGTCMHLHTHIRRIDTDEAKRMIVYAEKTKVKTHEQQPSHLTHVYFIAYSYTANQLLLWIYSLFIPSLSLTSRILFTLDLRFISVRFTYLLISVWLYFIASSEALWLWSLLLSHQLTWDCVACTLVYVRFYSRSLFSLYVHLCK